MQKRIAWSRSSRVTVTGLVLSTVGGGFGDGGGLDGGGGEGGGGEGGGGDGAEGGGNGDGGGEGYVV